MHKDEMLVTIATFQTEMEASLAGLEAIGIRALVPGEGRGTFAGPYQGTPREAELQVFSADRERARVALHRMQIRGIGIDIV